MNKSYWEQSEDDRLEAAKAKLEFAWGPAVPVARLAEIKFKTLDDLLAWEESCRKRATYATGRANGDGFWEAKQEWYAQRAAWIAQYRQEKERGNGYPAENPLRNSTRSFPPAPLKKRPFMPTTGGWPDATQPTTPPTGLTHSGPLTGPLPTTGLEAPNSESQSSGEKEEPKFLINEDN